MIEDRRYTAPGMKCRTMRVGVVGLGHMGRLHARILRQLEGVELVAAVDPAGDSHGAAQDIPVFADVDQILRQGIDYAVLACPTVLHTDIGLILAGAGIPTLIEKPLAADPKSALHLLRAFRDAGVPAAVGYTERFNPAVAALHGRLRDGLLGDVFAVSTRRTGTHPARVIDVGVIHDLATHDIDLVAWLTGQLYTSITARSAHRGGRSCEDLVSAIAQLANGTIVQHHADWLTPVPQRLITVTGERGCLIADTLAASLTLYRNSASPPEPDGSTVYRGVTRGNVTNFVLPSMNPLHNEHRAFRAAMSGQENPGATLENGLHAVLVAHSSSRSSCTGRTVPIPTAEAYQDIGDCSDLNTDEEAAHVQKSSGIDSWSWARDT